MMMERNGLKSTMCIESLLPNLDVTLTFNGKEI